MSLIRSFPFKKEAFSDLKKEWFGRNWPVVYVLENGKEIYIGETTNLYSRSKQHTENVDRQRLTQMHVITDEEYNKSATLDLESKLIQYISGEDKYAIQNGNGGLLNHNYFDKEKYQAKFEVIWGALQKIGIARQSLSEIRNSDIFKFSPYKALTEDQLNVVAEIEKNILSEKRGAHIVSGKPGTGKTVLAIYMMKHLLSLPEMKGKKIGLVIPMGSLRVTLERVFSRIGGLSSAMVIGPAQVVQDKYDVLIVDEAHRLKQRKNLPFFPAFDRVNTLLGLSKEGNELDWIMQSSSHQIFFYDANQSVRPGDVPAERFSELTATRYELVSQLRVAAGEDYTNLIDDLLALRPVSRPQFSNYDFRVYDDVNKMIADVKRKDSEYGLARVVAGFAWKWTDQGRGEVYDIKIGKTELMWNTESHDWVNSENAINEVGCIHTIQGYDLNYAAVIIGPELSYDEQNHVLVIDQSKYKDINGYRGAGSPEELKRYIINIYKTLLTRGIRGTYIYAVDDQLRAYLQETLSGTQKPKQEKLMVSPITIEMVQIPLVGSAPCGVPLLGETNIEEYIPVDKKKIKAGFKYFILRAKGDSMNQAGIQDGDLVLCRQQEKADTGDRVVALLGDNVTIKKYGARENGVRKLLPSSSNKNHKPITPGEGDSVQGIVQEVLE